MTIFDIFSIQITFDNIIYESSSSFEFWYSDEKVLGRFFTSIVWMKMQNYFEEGLTL